MFKIVPNLHNAKSDMILANSNGSALARPMLFLGMAVMVLAGMAMPAMASSEDFTGYARNVSNNANVLIDIFSYVSYIMGAVLAALGVNELRRVADGSGGGSLAWRQPLAKLAFGGMFLALPFITSVVQNTMGVGEAQDWTPAGLFRIDVLLPSSEGSLGQMIKGGSDQMRILVDVCAIAAYIMGVFFTVRGLQLLKQHIENPGNVQLPDSLKRLGVGGALFSLPFIVRIVTATFGANSFGYGAGLGIVNTGWTSDISASRGNGGLDGMMLNFVGDIANPAYRAIEVFCFVAGVVMILFAMQRLVKTAQDGPRGPLSLNTITMFIIAGLLISFPQLLAALNLSVTGSTNALTAVSFMSESADAQLDQTAKNVISGVLAFMAVVGFLSVVRGLFLLKTLTEGGQATLMQVVVHLVAGTLCVNLGALINGIQKTLGLTELAVIFS